MKVSPASFMKQHWLLDPAITFLNHGSFGATPIAVLEKQAEYRRRMEKEPVKFLSRDIDGLIDTARSELSRFLGAGTEDLAFVTNATAGVNAVLRSQRFEAGDELVVATHEYNASRNVLDYVAARSGANVVVVDIPFPIDGPDTVVERLLHAVNSKTRLLLIDHITSQTALIFPIERIIKEMHTRGVEVLVDGAHAPGMVPLNLRELGVSYYTGNLHKWVCAPKGAAFLYVREDRRARIRPIAISHGANSPRTDRSRYHLEFDWTGTFDPSAWLASADAIRFMSTLAGWPEIMRSNHALALRARDILCKALEIDPPAPDSMIGSMASFPISDGDADPLNLAFYERYKIEVPIMPWPKPPARLLRVSAQIYNAVEDYERLAAAITAELRQPA
jgi:isopenicillin-N epimerase